MLALTMRDATGTLIASALGVTVVQLNVVVVTVAFESLGRTFHLNIVDFQWMVNAYALVLAALLLSAGLLGDRYGPRRIFVTGFGLSALAALGAACALTYPMLIGMRALQGVGAALLLPASLSLIAHVSLNPAARAQAVGIWSGAGSLALALGPVVGGLLLAHGEWPMLFLPTIPLCLVGLWLTWRHAPRATGVKRAHFDWPGQLVAVIALASLIWSARSATQGWLQGPVWGGAAVFLTAAAAFVLIERGSSAPMVPPSLFRNSAFGAITVARALVNLAYYGLVFVFSLFFQTIQDLSALEIGFMFLPMTGSSIVMTVVAGRLCARYGPTGPALTGLVVAIWGYLILININASTSSLFFASSFLVVGVGMALIVPSVTIACLAAVRSQEAGIASGVLNASAQMGGVIGVAVFAAMLTNDHPGAFAAGTHMAVLTAVASLALSFILLLRFMKPPQTSSTGDDHT